MSDTSHDQPLPAPGTVSSPTAVDVLLGHQFVVKDTAVGGLATSAEGLAAFVTAPVYAACTCGQWEISAVTAKNADTKRGEHAEHVATEMRALGLIDGADKVEACSMFHEEPYDFATCETHDTTFPLGEECKFHNRVMWEVYADEADEQRGLKVRAEMEAEEARLDIDVLRAAVQQAMKDHPVSSATFNAAISHLLDTDTDVLRAAQKAAWKFGHAAAKRGLDETTNPF